MFASPSGQIQGLAEVISIPCRSMWKASADALTAVPVQFPSLDAATNVLSQAHNSPLGTKRLKLAFSKHPFH